MANYWYSNVAATQLAALTSGTPGSGGGPVANAPIPTGSLSTAGTQLGGAWTFGYTGAGSATAPTASGATNPDGLNDQSLELGQAKFLVATYKFQGLEQAGDVIYFGVLQAGQMVNPLLSYVVTSASIGTLGSLTFGDTDGNNAGISGVAASTTNFVGGTVSANASRYTTAITLTSAGMTAWNSALGVAALAPYKVTNDCLLTGTLPSNFSAPSSTAILTVWVALDYSK